MSRVLLLFCGITVCLSGCTSSTRGRWSQFVHTYVVNKELKKQVYEKLQEAEQQSLEYRQLKENFRACEISQKSHGELSIIPLYALIPEGNRSPASTSGLSAAATEKSKNGLESLPVKEVLEISTVAFQHGEYDRSARGFLYLQSKKEKLTPLSEYLLGVSLYQLGQIHLAKDQFNIVAQASPERSGLRERSYRWLAVLAQKTGSIDQEKKWLRSILNEYGP